MRIQLFHGLLILAAFGVLMASCDTGTTETDGEEAATAEDADAAKGTDGKAADVDADAAVKAETPSEPVGRVAPDASAEIQSYDDPHAVITLADGGEIVIKLEKEKVPNTVENFIRLAEQKFYDDTVFHRVLPDFMAQGGSPYGQGMGGPGWTIDLEIDPSLRHTRGSVAMARKQEPNTAGSQFYICYAAKPQLDDGYAVFGKVVSDMAVVDGLKKGSTNKRELSRHGMTDNEEGYPSKVATIRIVDGKPE